MRKTIDLQNPQNLQNFAGHDASRVRGVGGGATIAASMPVTEAAPLPSRRLGSLALAAIFVAASAVTALDYSFVVGEPTLLARREIHHSVFNHTATAPERHRWLAPLFIEGAIKVFGRGTPYDVAFDRTYAVFYVVAITAMIWALFAYLRVWFSDEQALIAVLLFASTMRITIRQHDYAPGSYLEPTFFALGLLLILRDRRILLGLLITVATLNRETAIFLVLLYAVTQPPTKKNLQTTLVFAVIWASVFAGVRSVAGPGERYWELERIWRTNISQPGLTLYNLTAFLGVMWLFAVAGFSRAPKFVRRTAAIVPVYIAVVAIWGIWWEVRLLMSLLPIVLPLALSYIVEPAIEPRATGVATVVV
jgi:hypothetical protein